MNNEYIEEKLPSTCQPLHVLGAATQLFVRSWQDRARKDNSKYTSIFWGPFPIPLSPASAGGRILTHNNLWSNLVWQLLYSHKFHWASQIIESFSMFIVTVNNRTRSFLHNFLFCTDDLKGQTQLPRYNSHSSKYYGNQTQPLEYCSGFTYQQWRHKGLHRKLPVGSSEPCIFLSRVRLQFQCSNPLQLLTVTSLVLLLPKKPLSHKVHSNPPGLRGVVSLEHSMLPLFTCCLVSWCNPTFSNQFRALVTQPEALSSTGNCGLNKFMQPDIGELFLYKIILK